MSEFSESYHLRSDRAEDAVSLLKRANRKGFVYQPINGWVTFVAESSAFAHDEQITAAATLPLLHFVSAEDHGWIFTLFDRNKVVCSYSCDWDDEIRFDDSEYSRPVLERFVPPLDAELLDAFEERMQPDDIEMLLEVEPAKLFAEAIGLEHYDWLSYSYLASDYQDSPDDFADVIVVA
jgi:hypothetical protein